MFYFLESDTRKQKKYEIRRQTSVDNTVINLRIFSEAYFFKIPKDLITSAFFLPRQILKNIDMPRQ